MTDHPACPRCRYDLTGEVAMWTVKCPLRLRCSECGHEMPSGRAFSRGPAVDEWSYEVGEGVALSRLLRTSIRAFRPRLFWRAHSRVEPAGLKRPLLFAACWGLVLVLVVHITAVVSGLSRWMPAASMQQVGWRRMQLFVWPYPDYLFQLRGFVLPFALGALLPLVFIWLGLMGACALRGRFRASCGRLLRGLCYGVPVPVLLVAALLAEQARNAHFPFSADSLTPAEVVVTVVLACLLGGYIYWIARWWSALGREDLARPRLGLAGVLLVLPALVLSGLVMLKVDEWLGP